MLNTYQTILSHTATIFVTFFLINAIAGLIDLRKLKEQGAFWHILMSFFIGIYTLFLGINTHITNNHISNSILLGHWVVSYLALFCYLNAIEYYLQKRLKLLIPAKIVFLSISTFYIINQFFFQFYKTSFLLKDIPSNFVTNYSKYSYITKMGSTFGTIIGVIGIVFIVYSSVIVWRELSRQSNKEFVLKAGIILCLLTGAYDSAIGLGFLKDELPLFYLAFALESIRLTFHNNELARNKLNNLQEEIIKLTKVAQYGVATASISHDIKNHLFIINTLLKRLIKKHEDKELADILKYTNEIDNVSNLYTNLFKKNLDSNTESVNIEEVIQNTKELTKKKVDKANIKINYSLDKDFNVNCNETELTLCLVNLINNSIEEIDSLENKWINVSIKNDEKTIRVVDSGLGVKSINPNKIFEYDYSTKKSNGGTGIGLAVARQLLRKSGYDLNYIKEASHTTFEINLN